MGVLNKKIKSFTLIELIIAIGVIWVLMMATTVYLWWTDEKRRVIEAQWCAYSLWGEITNFVFYALTSKNLKLENWTHISPDYYYVSLTWWTANGYNKILLSYSTWSNSTNKMKIYKTLSSSKNCPGNKTNLVYERTWWTTNIKRVIMNKWFSVSADDPSKNQVFEIEWASTILTWDIIISLCINDNCTTPKQISKFTIDWRPQTIFTKNCKFYEENDGTKCREREE